MKNGMAPGRNREYMTGLNRRRSVIALCCGALTLALSFYAILAGVIRADGRNGISGFGSFMYFTMIANTLAALSVAFVIPYAVEGIRKQRFTMPAWVAITHYVSVCSVVIVFVFVLGLVSWTSPEDAFGGPNLFLHVFCPILILISFLQMENGYIHSVRDGLLGCVPFLIYSVVYYTEVVLIGEENGGWPDLYHISEKVSPAIAFPLMILFGFGVSLLIAFFSNRLTRKRTEEMYRWWTADTEPVEARTEAYGLGRTDGMNSEGKNMQIPLDILEQLAQRCGLDRDELIRPYVTGFLHGRKMN